MNREDIIRMAREAGFNSHHNADLYDCMVASDKAIERFAKLVAAAELKRVADIIRSDKYGIGNMFSQWTSDDVADDILEGQA